MHSTSTNPYLLLDPFNHLYNPAKNIKTQESGGTGPTMYPAVWRQALRTILINGLRVIDELKMEEEMEAGTKATDSDIIMPISLTSILEFEHHE